jgi:hypothetical protein
MLEAGVWTVVTFFKTPKVGISEGHQTILQQSVKTPLEGMGRLGKRSKAQASR